MRKFSLYSFWAFLLINISACSVLSGKHFPLSSTMSETQTYAAQQQWQLTYGNEHYLLQVIVERTPEHWQWIMMNNLGQRLATATVTENIVKIEQKQSHPANALIPELLDALQFSFWNLIDLQKVHVDDWNFVESTHHRDIYFSNILQATVDYKNNNPWQGSLIYDDKKNHLHLIIESQLLN